jgi:hypothetical protein
MRRDAGARERLRALFDGTEVPPTGISASDAPSEPLIAALTTPVNPARQQGGREAPPPGFAPGTCGLEDCVLQGFFGLREPNWVA